MATARESRAKPTVIPPIEMATKIVAEVDQIVDEAPTPAAMHEWRLQQLQINLLALLVQEVHQLRRQLEQT